MSADKYNCPKCGYLSHVTNVVHTNKKEMVRYRHCRICNVSFTTTEALKQTPRIRQWLGEAVANKLWPEPPFKYRTIAQQNRAKKTNT